LDDFVLDKEIMTIGPKDDNDIRIDNLAVNGHHAKLLTIFDNSFLEDLDSANGAYVNGRQITRHPLKNSDVIEINKLKIEYYPAL
jgi:pSer/pThr/pTyr-binding forkhead associated (FHA) protein|tara:strand:+ start:355 stop:609 length:255 start_codon:yes stop_codon:yes gene_type:complete